MPGWALGLRDLCVYLLKQKGEVALQLEALAGGAWSGFPALTLQSLWHRVGCASVCSFILEKILSFH